MVNSPWQSEKLSLRSSLAWSENSFLVSGCPGAGVGLRPLKPDLRLEGFREFPACLVHHQAGVCQPEPGQMTGWGDWILWRRGEEQYQREQVDDEGKKQWTGYRCEEWSSPWQVSWSWSAPDKCQVKLKHLSSGTLSEKHSVTNSQQLNKGKRKFKTSGFPNCIWRYIWDHLKVSEVPILSLILWTQQFY